MKEYLSRWMLTHMRGFVIKHKAIFEKAIIAYADILPDPTYENVLEPNSHVLLDMRNKFFSYYHNPSKMNLFQATWKIAIAENEHDPHYRSLVFGWLVEEVVEAVLDGRWKPRLIGHPGPSTWNEPRCEDGSNYGLYNGRSFKNLIKNS